MPLTIETMTLEQAGRAIKVAMGADVPIVMVSRPGIGKSTKAYDVATDAQVTMYDYNLGDKEASDIGGLPVPVEVTVNPQGVKRVKSATPLTVKRLEYLIAGGLLPFDTDEHSLLFLDEIDRSSPETQNMAQRLVRERRVNGHRLSENCRIVCAMNGQTDRYTNELSEAFRNRMCFIYVTNAGEGGLKSYLEWGAENGASEMMRGFARFRPEVWGSDPRAAERPFSDLAIATPRSWDMADKIVQVGEQLATRFPTEDLIGPLVKGLVGHTPGAIEFLGYRDQWQRCPLIEDVIRKPDTTPLPDDPGILFAFTLTLASYASANPKDVKAIGTYGLRWPNDQASFLFTTLAEKAPQVVTTPAYQAWNRRNG